MTLYFITGNKHKFEEAQLIIPHITQYKADLVEIQSMDPHEIIKAKLEEACKLNPGKEFFCEDTSLYFEALNGFPGPLIKFFLGSLSAEGIYNLLQKYPSQKAIAKTVIGYSDGNHTHFFEGELDGTITKPSGGGGFGWDPIFTPVGCDVCFAKMPLNEKNKISHRNKAMEKLNAFLEKH